MIATNGGNPVDYKAPFEDFPSPPPPLIAVPTTAGTGSEVGSAAVITDLERKEKFVIKSLTLTARLAVLDPELLAGLPVQVAAQTSLDTLSHIVESFVSRRRTPLTESIALEAARRWGANLRAYLDDRSDPKAANHMIHASCMAGMSMSNAGLGLVHALAHPFGAVTHIPHGAVCAMFMPPVIRYNEAEVADRYIRLAEILAPALWPDGDVPEPLTPAALAEGIATLADRVGNSAEAFRDRAFGRFAREDARIHPARHPMSDQSPAGGPRNRPTDLARDAVTSHFVPSSHGMDAECSALTLLPSPSRMSAGGTIPGWRDRRTR